MAEEREFDQISEFINKKLKTVSCFDLGDKRLENTAKACVILRISLVELHLWGKWMRWIDFWGKINIPSIGNIYHLAPFIQSVRRSGIFHWFPITRKCGDVFIWSLEPSKNTAWVCEVKNFLSFACVETSGSSNYHINSYPCHCYLSAYLIHERPLLKYFRYLNKNY